jgi:hypothetical protein
MFFEKGLVLYPHGCQWAVVTVKGCVSYCTAGLCIINTINKNIYWTYIADLQKQEFNKSEEL